MTSVMFISLLTSQISQYIKTMGALKTKKTKQTYSEEAELQRQNGGKKQKQKQRINLLLCSSFLYLTVSHSSLRKTDHESKKKKC